MARPDVSVDRPQGWRQASVKLLGFVDSAIVGRSHSADFRSDPKISAHRIDEPLCKKSNWEHKDSRFQYRFGLHGHVNFAALVKKKRRTHIQWVRRYNLF